MAVYVFGCISCSQAFTLIRQDQAGPVTSASLSAVVLVPVVIHHINVQPHSPVHARLYDEHTHLWRARTLSSAADWMWGEEPEAALLLFNHCIGQLLMEFLGWQLFCLFMNFK